METVQYSLVVAEDLDLGTGTRQVRLQNGALAQAHQVHLGALLVPVTRTYRVTSPVNAMPFLGLLKAGWCVAGVTTGVVTTLTGSGLTGYLVGDRQIVDRWGQSSTLVAPATTSMTDFNVEGWPIYKADTDVVVASVGGLFEAGELEATVWYFTLTHRAAP